MTLQEKKDELKGRLGKKGRDDFYNLIERKGFVIDEYLENHYLNDEEEEEEEEGEESGQEE